MNYLFQEPELDVDVSKYFGGGTKTLGAFSFFFTLGFIGIYVKTFMKSKSSKKLNGFIIMIAMALTLNIIEFYLMGKKDYYLYLPHFTMEIKLGVFLYVFVGTQILLDRVANQNSVFLNMSRATFFLTFLYIFSYLSCVVSGSRYASKQIGINYSYIWDIGYTTTMNLVMIGMFVYVTLKAQGINKVYTLPAMVPIFLMTFIYIIAGAKHKSNMADPKPQPDDLLAPLASFHHLCRALIMFSGLIPLGFAGLVIDIGNAEDNDDKLITSNPGDSQGTSNTGQMPV